MKKRTLMLATMALTVVCLTHVSAQGQNGTAAHKRSVVVKIKNGPSVRGILVEASKDSIALEVEDASCPIRLEMEDVAQIAFDTRNLAGKRADRESPQTIEAAREALEALRRMAAVAEAGMSYGDYGNRLVYAKIVVDDALVRIPEGDLKREIHLAMLDCEYAGLSWQMLLNTSSISADSQLARILMSAYPSIKPVRLATDSTETISRNDVLSAAWNSARTHLDRAETLQLQQ